MMYIGSWYKIHVVMCRWCTGCRSWSWSGWCMWCRWSWSRWCSLSRGCYVDELKVEFGSCSFGKKKKNLRRSFPDLPNWSNLAGMEGAPWRWLQGFCPVNRPARVEACFPARSLAMLCWLCNAPYQSVEHMKMLHATTTLWPKKNSSIIWQQLVLFWQRYILAEILAKISVDMLANILMGI